MVGEVDVVVILGRKAVVETGDMSNANILLTEMAGGYMGVSTLGKFIKLFTYL